MRFPSWLGFCLRFEFCSCHSFHIMSSCASHLHSCSPHACEHFPRCPFRNPTLPHAPDAPLLSLFVSGSKPFSEWARFDKWPWYITRRPPVKFRSIWRPFDAPTVNRVTVKASFVLQPNTPPKRPNNPSKPIPCPSLSDQDRVGENYTSLGHSYLLLAIYM